MFFLTPPPPSTNWKVYTENVFSKSGTMVKIRANFFLPPDFFPSRTPMAVMLVMLVMLSMIKIFPKL